MSRSYRKPFAAITGVPRAYDDKKTAARGLRRKQNQWLNCLADYDDSLLPHRLECFWSNPYNWLRDGRQSLVMPHKADSSQQAYMRQYWTKIQRK